MPESTETVLIQGPVRKHKSRRRILVFCVVSLLNLGLLAFLLVQLLTPAPKTAISDPLIGHAAPGFSLAELNSSSRQDTISLSDFKGKALVLNFWASWCAPCKEEMPLLETAWKQMQAQGKNVIFLGINFQETGNTATTFLQQNNITYSTALDINGSVAVKYGITGLPDTIFINRNGMVISKVAREITRQELASNLLQIT